MIDALVEDYFRYDELAQMEAEAIRHNITQGKSPREKNICHNTMQGGKPITEVAQLGGWKNIGSLNHYSVHSIKQEEAFHTISSVMIPDHNILSRVSDNRDNIESSVEIVDDMN